MLSLHSKRSLVILCLAGAALATAFLSSGRGDEAETERIERLVQQLDDNSLTKREAASKDLVAIGEVALPALRQAAIGQGLEFNRRVDKVTQLILKEVVRKSKSTGMELAPISPGEFTMGSPKKEAGRRPDESAHVVRITSAFLLGTHEVTQDEYQLVMTNNPSAFHAKGLRKEKVARMSTRWFPVESVTWYDAVEFCNRLSKMDGYEPYYTLADVKRDGDAVISADVTIAGGNGYRLPTEAEWEYACRAETTTLWHFGNDTRHGVINCRPLSTGNYVSGPKWQDLERPTRVGSYPANNFSLLDMHGNVAEWCWDWYDKDYYEQSPKADPSGPDRGTHRVLRGGNWMISEGSCRSASRFFHAPNEKKDYAGFRVARTLGPPRKPAKEAR